MSPHLSDRAQRLACEELLYIDARQVPRTPSGRVQLDWAEPAQQAFQALLVSCLMNTSPDHPLEHPERRCLSSVVAYLNVIISRPGVLEFHVNTACRVASRLMPVVYNGGCVAGIPGLRFMGVTRRRVQLLHLPTGARLDLIDSRISCWYNVRDMRRSFLSETDWHQEDGFQPLWHLDHLSDEEEAHARWWARQACTPLRSAILTRGMALWYESSIQPTWKIPLPGSRTPRLEWRCGPDHHNAAQIAELLTAPSPIAIPGATFHVDTAHNCLLALGESHVQLASVPRSP